MAPLVTQTLIEPSTVASPLSTIYRTLTSTITASLETLTSTPTPTTSPTPNFATETPAIIPSLPSNIATPEPESHQSTPAIAILTLVFVVLLAASILSALLYFIVLRIRGRCTNCIPLEDELHKWKTGQLKPITREMVDARMRKWDEENVVEGTGAMGVQASLYRNRMRMESLGMLEGREGSVRDSVGESEKTLAVEEDDEDKESTASSSFRPESNLKDLRPLVKAIDRKFSDDGTTASKHESFPKSHSQYLEKIIKTREAEAARLRHEGQDQTIERNIDIASDPSKRESVRERALGLTNDLIEERVKEEKEKKEKEQEDENKKVTRKYPMPAPRVNGKSRFKERFSLEMQRGSVSKFPGMQ